MAKAKTKNELEADVYRLEKENEQLRAAKAEFDKAMRFAQVVKENIYNPNNPNRRYYTTTYSRYTKEDIERYLQSPSSNERTLRNASRYMWDLSWHYRRLILYYAQLPKYAYVLTPFMTEASAIKQKTYHDSYLKAAKYVELMKLKHTMENVNKIALKEGIFYGVIVSTKDTFFIQKINPDYCVLSSKSDDCWNFAIDCSQIKEDEIEVFYTPEIQALWKEYKNTGVKYQEVPEEISFCIKADESEVYSVPYFAGIMPNLYMIAEYENLQKTASEIENYKLIAGQIPMNEDGTPQIDWGLATQYYNHLCNNLPDFIGAAITPFELQDFDFPQSNGVASVDIVARSTEQYWQEVGTPSAIHGAGTATATGLKIATKIDELISIDLIKQEETAINRLLKKLPGTVHFRITILPVTRLNEDDMISHYKDAASFGIAKSYYAASIGLQPLDVANLSYIEENLLGFDELVPMSNTYNTSSDATVGRPKSDNPSDKTIENEEKET